MGNSALIVVVASILSGVLILLNIQRINTESNVVQTHLQEEVLARELAHTGLSLVLAKMYTPDGISTDVDFGGGSYDISYQGGDIFVQGYTNETEIKQIEFKVRGEYGEAQYLIQSRYQYAVDFPFSLYWDVPYLDVEADEGATFYGGPDADISKLKLGTTEYQRIQEQEGLGGLIDMNAMINDLTGALNDAWDGLPGEITQVEQLDSDNTFSDVLPDIDPDQNSPWLEEFYYQTLDKMQVGVDGSDDAYFSTLASFGAAVPGDAGYGLNYTFGSTEANAIVRVDGDMIIHPGSAVFGHGTLLIEGDLTVPPGATLDWDGIVFLRPESKQSTTSLQGNVSIDGSILAFQEALPPGSHMDVTSNRNINGPWALPRGADRFDGSPVIGPWYSHRHKWNAAWTSYPPVSANLEVIFRRDGGPGEHEYALGFNKALSDVQAIGISEIYLEFVNAGQSGMGLFSMQMQDGTTYTSSIAGGFGGGRKSPAFAPNELQNLGMQFRSLRMLKLMKDPEGTPYSDDGPHRISDDYAREGAFHVAIRNAENDELLMTTAVYQHIREIENDEYEEELDELRDDIVDGNFGLKIEFGPNAAYRYDNIAASDALNRTGFSAFAHLGTWTQRCNSSDYNCDLSQE